MNVLEAVKKRRSIRKFKPEPLAGEVEEKLRQALVWAPSAGNLQARQFYFVFAEALKANLATAALNQGFIATAPLVVVGCTDSAIRSRYGQRGVELYAIQDVAAALMGMMLVGHQEGLGSVWVGAFNEDEVAELLQLPDNLRPVAMVPVGMPAAIPSPPPRVSPAQAIVEIRD